MDPDLLDADFAAWQGLKPTAQIPASNEGRPRPPPVPFEASPLDPLRQLHEQVLSQLRQVNGHLPQESG